MVCEWMDTQVVDEDDDDWFPVVRGKGGQTNMRQILDPRASASQNNKRSLEGNSSEEDHRMACRTVERQEFKIIIKLRKEDEQMSGGVITGIIDKDWKKRKEVFRPAS